MSNFDKESDALRALYQNRQKAAKSGKNKTVLTDETFADAAAEQLQFGNKSQAQVRADDRRNEVGAVCPVDRDDQPK